MRVDRFFGFDVSYAVVRALRVENPACAATIDCMPTSRVGRFVHLEGRVIFHFAWSLAAEEQFYVVWQAVQKVFTPKVALLLFVVVIVVVTVTQLLSDGGMQAEKGLTHRIVIGIPLAICLGLVRVYALHQRLSFDALRWMFASRASAVVWFGVLIRTLS